MERLTKYSESQREYIIDCKYESCDICKENILSLCSMQDKVIQKCGEYENTGLTPQEVEFYVKCGNKLIDKELFKLQEENAELKARLEKAVELPCKVGDILYTNFSVQGDYFKKKNRPYSCKVIFIGINSGECFANIEYINGRQYQFFFKDFGKTVFLTRKEAEQALKEREEK